MTTPIELAREQLVAAQAEVQRLEHEVHQLSRDRAVALAAGDVNEANRINTQISGLNNAYRLAGGAGGGHLAEGQGAVQREERAIRQARSRVADLSNAFNRLRKESIEVLERAHLLTSGLATVQQQLVNAQQQLAQLEPPEQPVVAPEPAPAPEVEREPAPERPYRVVGGFGSQTRYYNRAGEETDAQNRPLILLAETITDSADEQSVG